MARVHDHYHAGKRGARAQIGVDQLLPLLALRVRCAREAVTGQVDEARPARQLVEVDGLRTPGRLAGEGEALALEQRIDRARLADVRAAGERQLRRPGRRQIARAASRREKLCLRE
jgi:hypothetical protein